MRNARPAHNRVELEKGFRWLSVICRPVNQAGRFAALIALCAALAACGKSGSDPAPAAPAPNVAQPKAAESHAAGSAFDVVTKSGVEAVFVPAGTFTMGSAQGNPDEAPPHQVTLAAFLIDKFEVSQDQYAKVQLPNPSHWQDSPKKPVERVRWRDAKQFCNERSLLEGLKPCYNEKTPEWDCDYSANGYRLPTEAEWEYACRSGSDEPYHFGQADKLRQFAWFADNAEQKTHAVGQKKPNRWGIFDMDGNVSEWCEDVFSPTAYQAAAVTNPHGPPSPGKDVKRVIRGGSWKSSPDMCRASFRQGERTGDTDACFLTDYCGFRCVRTITLDEAQALKAK